MSVKASVAVLAVVTTIAAPAAAWGMGMGLGCINLPEYNRALGTLQGISSCDMTVEQARHIVAAHDGPAAVYPQAAPTPPARYRRQRLRTSHP